MTHDELKAKIYSGLDMVLEKAEKIGKVKAEMTIDELGKMSDILKDVSEAHKNMAKAHMIYSEHSPERY